MQITPAQLLEKMQQLYKTFDHTRVYSAVDADGRKTGATSDTATCLCLAGCLTRAVWELCGRPTLPDLFHTDTYLPAVSAAARVRDRLEAQGPGGPLAVFNATLTKKAKVLKVIRKAAASCK